MWRHLKSVSAWKELCYPLLQRELFQREKENWLLCHSFWPGYIGNSESLVVLFPLWEIAVGRTLVLFWHTSVHLENKHTKSCFLEHGRIKPQQALSVLRKQNVVASKWCAEKCPGFCLEYIGLSVAFCLLIYTGCLCWDSLNQSQAPEVL